MIRKNRQGRVLVFEDESILPSRQARKNAASLVAADGSQEVSTAESPASEGEIESQYEAAVLKANDDSVIATGVEMVHLEAQVADLDAGARWAREAARQKFAQAQREAERICRQSVEAAEAERDAVLDLISSDFHAAMAPINAEAAAILARQKKILDEALSRLGQRRASQLQTLAEARRLASEEKKAIVEEAARFQKEQGSKVEEIVASGGHEIQGG